VGASADGTAPSSARPDHGVVAVTIVAFGETARTLKLDATRSPLGARLAHRCIEVALDIRGGTTTMEWIIVLGFIEARLPERRQRLELFGRGIDQPLIALAGVGVHARRQHHLLLAGTALDLADLDAAPDELRGQARLPRDVIVKFSAAGPDPRLARLAAELGDHLRPDIEIV
jgi:hypothetical protein